MLLKLLIKTPEILLLILEELPDDDLLSLLQTCKALSPICKNALWSTLEFHWCGESMNERTKGLANLVNTKGVDATGLKYTRTLRLGYHIFNWEWDYPREGGRTRVRPAADIISVLADLLDGNKVDFQRVEVNMSHIHSRARGYENGPVLTDDEERLFCSLKKYSESRVSKFSIRVSTSVVSLVPKYFNLDDIAELEISIPYSSERDRDIRPWADEPMSSNILELADLLTSIPNLKLFSWKADYFSPNRTLPELSDSLAKLQTVFTNMRSLREFQLHDCLFHPEFFLVPPDSVTRLWLGTLSREWWAQFAECPLPSVRVITAKGWPDPHKDYHYMIGDVAIRGLQELYTTGYNIPADLETCMLRRNKGLTRRSVGVISKERATRLMRDIHQNFCQQAKYAAVAAASKYTPKLFECSDIPCYYSNSKENYMHQREFGKQYAEIVHDAFFKDTDLSIWSTAETRARDLGSTAKKELEGAIYGIVKRNQAEYLARVAEGVDYGKGGGEEGEMKEFLAQCIRDLGEWSGSMPASDLDNKWTQAHEAAVGYGNHWWHRYTGSYSIEALEHRATNKIAKAFENGTEQDIEKIKAEWFQEKTGHLHNGVE
ncbi:hypothetical protein TWF281_009323 [Arthrobotrys megalospora]